MNYRLATSGSVLAGVMMLAGIVGAQAAPAAIDRSPSKIADAVQVSPVAAVDTEDEANCSTARKRLWVESEGWVVRKVTICR